MPVKRALVDCAVLSLQDTCVVYPYCKECFSRIYVEVRDATRYRCPKCGFSCPKEQVDYRYRLSLRVARDSYIFGVTVFGTCLNPLFGINAHGLHRLVENSNQAVKGSTRSTLLVKAVQDCFIGRHLIFGLKITGNSPFSGGPTLFGSSCEDRAHFIATQIILPQDTALKGYSVIKYYQSLLQKAAEYPLGSTSPSKASRLPATLLLIPQPLPNCSFSDSPSATSCLQRSLHHDCTLSPTPLLQQSLGLVTSSAEQEEGCSTQGSAGELTSRQIHSQRPYPHRRRRIPEWQRDGLGKLEVTGKRAASPRLSFHEHGCCSGSSFHSITNLHNVEPCSSLCQAGHSRTTGPLCTRAKSISDVDRSCSIGAEAWEDLPFSESLEAFLCDEDGLCEVEQIFPQRKSEPTCCDASLQPPLDKSSVKDSVAQSRTQLSDSVSHRKVLADISNAAAQRYGDDNTLDSINQTCLSPYGCDVRSQAIRVSIDSMRSDRSVSARIRKCEAEEESLELWEGEGFYDCSADLFNGSLITSMSTATVETNGDGDKNNLVPYTHRTLRSKPDIQWHDSESSNCLVDFPLSPAKQVINRCCDLDHCEKLPDSNHLKSTRKDAGLICSPYKLQSHHFIPPSQSTPIVKTGTSTRRTHALAASSLLNPVWGDSDAIYSDTSKQGCEKTGETALLLQGTDVEHNSVCRTTPRRHSFKHTHDNTFLKLYRPTCGLVARQCLTLQRKRKSTGRTTTNLMLVTSLSDTSMCDYEDDKAIVPPSKTKTLPAVMLRLREQTKNCGEDFGYSQRELPVDGCRRMLLTQAPTPACELPGGIERAEGSLNSTNKHPFLEESEAFNCSGDLFSDSFF